MNGEFYAGRFCSLTCSSSMTNQTNQYLVFFTHALRMHAHILLVPTAPHDAWSNMYQISDFDGGE